MKKTEIDDDSTELEAALASLEDNGPRETLDSTLDTIHALLGRIAALESKLAEANEEIQSRAEQYDALNRYASPLADQVARLMAELMGTACQNVYATIEFRCPEIHEYTGSDEYCPSCRARAAVAR